MYLDAWRVDEVARSRTQLSDWTEVNRKLKFTKNREKGQTVFPSGLGDQGWCHMPGVWTASEPQAGVWWGWGPCGGGPAKEPPWDLEHLVPFEWDLDIQIQVGPLAAQPPRTPPKSCGPYELGEHWLVSGSPLPPWCRCHQQPPSWRPPPRGRGPAFSVGGAEG